MTPESTKRNRPSYLTNFPPLDEFNDDDPHHTALPSKIVTLRVRWPVPGDATGRNGERFGGENGDEDEVEVRRGSPPALPKATQPKPQNAVGRTEAKRPSAPALPVPSLQTQSKLQDTTGNATGKNNEKGGRRFAAPGLATENQATRRSSVPSLDKATEARSKLSDTTGTSDATESGVFSTDQRQIPTAGNAPKARRLSGRHDPSIPTSIRCKRCIINRKKCDGATPRCGNCSKMSHECEYVEQSVTRAELEKEYGEYMNRQAAEMRARVNGEVFEDSNTDADEEETPQQKQKPDLTREIRQELTNRWNLADHIKFMSALDRGRVPDGHEIFDETTEKFETFRREENSAVEDWNMERYEGLKLNWVEFKFEPGRTTHVPHESQSGSGMLSTLRTRVGLPATREVERGRATSRRGIRRGGRLPETGDLHQNRNLQSQQRVGIQLRGSGQVAASGNDHYT